MTIAPYRNVWEGNRFVMPPLPTRARPIYADALKDLARDPANGISGALHQNGVTGGEYVSPMGLDPNAPMSGGSGLAPNAPASREGPGMNFGRGSNGYGTALGIGGGLLGLGAGIPGLGAIGSAVGTGIDVTRANDALEAIGRGREVAFGPAFASNMTYGLAGVPTRAQYSSALSQMTPDQDMDFVAGQNAGFGGPMSGGGYGGMDFGGDGVGPSGYASGGMVQGLAGPNPPGPDDGLGYLDNGEFVIRKEAVQKYGPGLLQLINDGAIPVPDKGEDFKPVKKPGALDLDELRRKLAPSGEGNQERPKPVPKPPARFNHGGMVEGFLSGFRPQRATGWSGIRG